MPTSRNTTKVKKAARTPPAQVRPANTKAARTPSSAAPRVSANGKGRTKSPLVLGPEGKEQLQKERAQVENELAMLRAELLEAPETTGDEVDLNVYEREKTLGLVSAYERRLEEIDAALRAATQGTYGICERCGNAIDPERLKIFPEARLCVNCKSAVEREARRLRM
ncbi:MAG: TraR/DksA C4-type zinc finger protein [Chloroflexi bacterium]|nr:TraR/DksA C4-type zinc finger protein [Chloroflexota bacterium]